MYKQESLISEERVIALGYLADIKAMAVGRVTKFPQKHSHKTPRL